MNSRGCQSKQISDRKFLDAILEANKQINQNYYSTSKVTPPGKNRTVRLSNKRKKVQPEKKATTRKMIEPNVPKELNANGNQLETHKGNELCLNSGEQHCQIIHHCGLMNAEDLHKHQSSDQTDVQIEQHIRYRGCAWCVCGHTQHELNANHEHIRTPLHEPRILLPLPRAQSILPQELVLIGTNIPDAHLHVGMKGRTRSKYFADRSITQSFISILIAPRLFPQKILETKVLKTRSTPYLAVVIIKYREDEQTLIKSFSSPIFDRLGPAKLDACSATSAYIIRNFRAELELLDNITLMVYSRSNGDQFDEEDPNVENMLHQPSTDGILEGEPSAIKDRSSDTDKDMTETHHSKNKPR